MNAERLKVLIVDDQPAVVQALKVLFELHDLPTVAADGPAEALEVAGRENLGAVVQDMNFDPGETSGEAGAELFRALRDGHPGLPVVLMTAWASLETAVELVRDGAADYLQKPWDDDKLVTTVANLLRLRELEIENDRLREELRLSRRRLEEEHDLCGIVFASEKMFRTLSLAVQVAPSDAPVLVTGPPGSGKERLAEIVQANSRRRDRPFVRINVGAIPEEQMEAELFGAEAGSYTGQRGRREGVFEAADKGTLFLDEIDSLAPAGQVKLLRVLQSGELQRLGTSRPRRVDVRVISATNADLESALETGRFREDLFFRLNVVELALPALAARSEDILPLARHFLESFREDSADGAERTLSPEAENALLSYDWPGNVRELENRIRRATLVGAEPELTAGDVGLDRDGAAEAPDLAPEEAAERQDLIRVLSEENGIVARAADRLGVSRQALYRRMARLGVELERRPRS